MCGLGLGSLADKKRNGGKKKCNRSLYRVAVQIKIRIAFLIAFKH